MGEFGRQYEATVSSLYETVLDARQWDVAIANVGSLFQASTVTMFRFDYALGVPSDFRCVGTDPAVEDRYASYYHTLDPGRPVALGAQLGEWLADEQMLDLRSRRDQEYIQDFALPSGIGRAAGCKVAGDDSHCVFLGLQRQPGQPRFGEDARRLIDSLRPHLARISAMQRRIDRLQADATLAKACFDRLHGAVLVVDGTRRIRMLNAYAELQAKGPSPVISTRGNRLRFSHPRADEQLTSLLAKACCQPGEGGAFRVRWAEAGHPVLTSVVPIPPTHDLSSGSGEPLALVVLTRGNDLQVPPALYRTAFSLTQAEASLLAGLAAGTSVANYAAERHVSLATVRTQLRSLFEKTGVDSQARLVALTRCIPPIFDR